MQPRFLAHALALASLTACTAKVDSTDIPGAQTVAIVVDPSSASLVTGQATQFAADVTGTADLLVTWKVDEAGGGTVDQSGMYSAPASAGIYHVRAVSHAQPELSGVAAVAVTVPPAGSVAISPRSTTLTAGGTVTFTAIVTGLASSAVTWRLQEASGCGSVSSTGVYTAPAAAATCHVVVTSAADTSKSDVSTVTVTAALAIAISPTTATVDACKAFQFGATVTGGGTDKAVVWSVAEGTAGGTVSSAGLYTAPSSAGSYHVVATAHASSAVKTQATVTVQDHILSIAVNPSTTSILPDGTQQFRATITTSCGTFTAQ
jgi:hypothetical protein